MAEYQVRPVAGGSYAFGSMEEAGSFAWRSAPCFIYRKTPKTHWRKIAAIGVGLYGTQGG